MTSVLYAASLTSSLESIMSGNLTSLLNGRDTTPIEENLTVFSAVKVDEEPDVVHV